MDPLRAIFCFSWGILGQVFKVLSLYRETGEGKIKLCSGDSDEGIPGNQVKGRDLDVQGRPFVWEGP